MQLVREELPAIKTFHPDWGRVDFLRFVRFTAAAVTRADWEIVQRAFALAHQAFAHGDPKLRNDIFDRLLREVKFDGANGEIARGLLSAELSQARDGSLARAQMVETAIVSIYQQPTQYFLNPMHGGGRHLWRAGPPSLALRLDTAPAKLGEAVLYLLGECRTGVESPELSRTESLALLKPGRVRSWMALQRKAMLVHVVACDHTLWVEPTRNGGNRGDDAGFHFLSDRAEVLERNPAAPVLGASVRRAFEFSTPPPAP